MIIVSVSNTSRLLSGWFVLPEKPHLCAHMHTCVHIHSHAHTHSVQSLAQPVLEGQLEGIICTIAQ
jgi:hypothetical protein